MGELLGILAVIGAGLASIAAIAIMMLFMGIISAIFWPILIVAARISHDREIREWCTYVQEVYGTVSG